MSINYNNSGGVPAPFTNRQQYKRYLRCLQQNNLSASTSPGRFTVEQLKCATQILGYCPPGYENTCTKIPELYNADTPVFSRYSANNDQPAVNVSAIQATSNFVPAAMKTTQGKVIDPALYGYSVDMSADRYVNATSQRISGGKIVPLVQQLQTVDRTPRELENFNLLDEPWSKNLPQLSNLNRTTKTLYNPSKVSSTVTINNSTVNNIRGTTRVDNNATQNNSENTITRPAFNEPAVNNNTPETYVNGSQIASQTLANTAAGNGINQYDPAIPNNVRFNRFPLVDITPLELSSNGTYIPAGPAARAQISAPTPETTISQEDLLGIPAGTELVINGRKITIRGIGLTDIKNQINCKSMGIKALTNRSDTELSLVSCNGSPFTIANGCGGGTYKQVGDFHVNRGFEQSRNETVSASDAMYYPLTETTIVGGSSPVAASDQKTRDKSIQEVYRYEYDFDNNRIVKLDDTEFYQLPAKVPLVTRTRTTTYTTGGSGYRVGDRLRLIGGTPVNNTKAPLTKICIDSAGAGYSDPTEIQIIISTQGDSSGIGATAVVSRLDQNGGIAEIIMTNWGTGYDINKPPQIEVRDLAPNNNVVQLDASWPEALTVPARSTVAVNVQRGVYDINGILTNATVSTRYVRTTAPTTFGETVTVDYDNVSAAVPITGIANSLYPNRAVVDFADFGTVNFQSELRPNSYVNIMHYPVSLEDSSLPVTVVSIDTVSQQITLSVTGTTVSRMAASAAGIIIKDQSGVNQCVIQYDSADVNAQQGTITTTYQSLTGVPTITADDTVTLCYSKQKLYWIPEPKTSDDVTVNTSAQWFIIEDTAFGSPADIAAQFPAGAPIQFTAKKFWAYNLVPTGAGDRPRLVDTVDPNIARIPAELSARIGIRPGEEADPGTSADQAFLDGYSGLAGPQRVAKFLVTGVDSTGAITSLRCIDRGIYKIFPSDLTYGIPLEYDAGAETLSSTGIISQEDRKHSLGIGDPARGNIGYGPGHPEQVAVAPEGRIVRNGKHPDWAQYPEFYWNGESFIPYTGTPGAYDPNTYVIIDSTGINAPESSAGALAASRTGRLLSKAFAVDSDPYSATFGEYLRVGPGDSDLIQSGGSGARVFITAQEIPNCTEKGSAKEALGLPDAVEQLNAPNALARALNDALQSAGYLPEDINFSVRDIGDIGVIELDSDFPGINVDSPSPGFLPELGLATGDYNSGMLCIQGTLEQDGITDSEALAKIDALYDTGAFGLLDEQAINELTGRSYDFKSPTNILSLVCVNRLGNPDLSDPNVFFGNPNNSYSTPAGLYNGPYPLNDNNSIFSDAAPASITELFKYSIVNPFGAAVTLGGTTRKQNTPVNVFASKRFNVNNTITDSDLLFEPKAWLDNYANSGKWAYLENGTVAAAQQDLVDVNFIRSAFVYDGDTGHDVTVLDFWDPFKGILPGFIRNELHFISETDPVSYNDSRTSFGRNNVGKTWWDTSTVRYQWYEQGSKLHRQQNWGKTFPGSTITVCEWVESKSLPENFSGNGTPRWTNRFVTERMQDPVTGQYTLYYYYWVQNRTVLDDRVKRDLHRQFDVQTLARYIANPAGYGLRLISFVDTDSMLISNTESALDYENNHLQVNFSRNNNANGIKHTAWKLLREGDNNSIIPQHLTDKLIDSISGVNALAQPVPDPTLSPVEAYGIDFRPRQSMFVNIQAARRVLASILNLILADIKLNSQYPEWDAQLPSEMTYVKQVSWYAIDRMDAVTNQPIRYDSSYKPVFTVSSVAELYRLSDLPDGTVIQVASAQNATAELWLYSAPEQDFKQIAIANETVRLTDGVYTDGDNAVLQNELRLLLTALYRNVFTTGTHWNNLFFDMLRHAHTEQGQLSWAFKTSYLYVEKQENDLTQFTGFKPDNFEKVLTYMNEVKPYSAKIREYKDGKRTPVDVIGQNNVSDYDKPPYVDSATNEVRVLDDLSLADFNIMANSSVYVDYVSNPDKSAEPFRKIHSKLVFDRTNWQLTEPQWDKTQTPLTMSIARNMANLAVADGLALSSDANVRAADRIFKFDPQVQATFIAEINTYFNDITASSNAAIVGNADALFEVIEAGQLKLTQELVKQKVGGNWRGDTLDGARFNTIIQQVDYLNEVLDEFGFDTELWDANSDNDTTVYTDESALSNYGPVTSIGIGDTPWDSTIQLVDYEGVFNTATQGNVTLRRNDEQVEGFDGVTFQRVLYGEERPEEMVLIDPLESVVFTVTTSESAIGQATFESKFDPDDDSVSNQHAVVSVHSVNILNAGVGYVNPVVVFTDAINNSPVTEATATATVDSTGAVTDITVTHSGEGYENISVTVISSATERTAGTANLGSHWLSLSGTANVRMGQPVIIDGNTVGTVLEINGNDIRLSEQIVQQYADNTMVTFTGTDFVGQAETGTVTQGTVYIDRQFAIQQLTGLVDYTLIPGNTSVVQVNDVQFSDIELATGADPHKPQHSMKTGIQFSWDSANVSYAPGSFDFEVTEAGILATQKVAPDAQPVTYRTHMSLFGNTDYLRIRPETSTVVVDDVYPYSEHIEVADASFVGTPTAQQPGEIWINSERINFTRRNGNTLSMLTRGVAGTTIQHHSSGSPVYSAAQSEHFNDLNPRANVWLDLGTKYSLPSSWDEAVDNTPGNPNDNDWTVQRAWDEIANTGITSSTVDGEVISVNVDQTEATIFLLNTANVQIGEGVLITSSSNTELSQAVIITEIDGDNIDVADSNGLDSDLFVANAEVTVTAFNYAGQESDDTWDAATITGETALSLTDRANADLTNAGSIMRFLHNI